jgi:hypothetical protein
MTESQKKPEKTLTEQFYDYVTSMIDEVGIYPLPGVALGADGILNFAAIDDPHLVIPWFWEQIANHGAKEVLIGLDRSTLDGQGTEFADVLTCAHWKEGMDGKPWNEAFRIGVINYQHEPRIVRPFDFSNEFWIKKMTGELVSRCPKLRITTVNQEP